MAIFTKAFTDIIDGHEGGYVNDPTDRGGETYRGIARKVNPSWGGWSIIDGYKAKTNFPKNLAADNELNMFILAFYKHNYWDILHLDEINNQGIATEMFDVSVNMGPRQAVLFVQRALNLLNKNQKSYKDITVDGRMGFNTLDTVNNNPIPDVLLKTMNGLQFSRYVQICDNDPSQEKFFIGWLKRT